MKVVVFNVKYSPNLGDGILASCLEQALSRRLPDAEIVTLDLAGRTAWMPPRPGGRRAVLLALLGRLPAPLRSLAVRAALGALIAFRLRPAWRAALADADMAVVGGGQLLQDHDLNFPLKLHAAGRECRRIGVPVALHAVGVAEPVTRAGHSLLRRFVGHGLVRAGARDEKSCRRLRELGARDVALARDPGLLAAQVWPAAPRSPRQRPRIGLCVTHPTILRHHAPAVAHDQPDIVYRDIVSSIAKAGHDVLLFTNGAHEDEAFLQVLSRDLGTGGDGTSRIEVAPRAENPRALCRLIADLDGVVAHRMHAVIAAFAYGVPAIGLEWDDKLASFLASVGQQDRLLPFATRSSAAVGAQMSALLRSPLDRAMRNHVVGEAETAITDLAHAIRASTVFRPSERHPRPSLADTLPSRVARARS